MLFNSSIFLFVFLPTVLTVCAIYGRGHVGHLIKLLVLFSLIFYAWWKPAFIVLIILTISVNFALGRLIYRSQSRPLLLLGIALNIAPLAVFKYYNFAANGVEFLGLGSLPLFNLFLPLAISFLTFEQISYLTDCKRRTIAPAAFWDYAFFVLFFPKLIAGPIVRYSELQPQLKNLAVTLVSFTPGATLFIIGLGKKVILADSVVTYTDSVFLSALTNVPVGGLDAWMATMAYSTQIYFDFSGYSDMALGLALMFGVRLPVNFDSPYKSRNIIEFWRRWHMTLSRFLRDYLYFPLGGGRGNAFSRYRNLTLVMLVGGLWHGAGVNFIIWGGLHAVYLVINHAFRDYVKALVPAGILDSRIWTTLSWLLTLAAVAVAWVFFRAGSLNAAVSLLSAMFGVSASAALAIQIASAETIAIIAFLIGIALLLPNSMEIMDFKSGTDLPSPDKVASKWRWKPSLGWAAVIGCIATASIVSLSKPAPFLYFQF